MDCMFFFSAKPGCKMTVELVSSFPSRNKGLCFQLIQPILVKQELMKLQKIAEFIWEMMVPFLTAAGLMFFAGCCFRAVQTNLSGGGHHSALPHSPTFSDVFSLLFVYSHSAME